jgi:RNA polymerase sigma factor (sigma-70 family)
VLAADELAACLRERFSGDRRTGDDATALDMAAVTHLEPVPVSGASGDDDAVVIRRSWSEPERFADVFDRYYVEIHGYAARRLGPSLADDVVSETFLIAFDRRRRYDVAQQNARPWLYGIAANLIARHRRAEVRQYRALARADTTRAVDGHAERSATRLDAEALRGRLAAALLAVADRDREVLLLVAWAQLSCEEAARALGIPPGTARSRLHRARRKTRAALADGEDNR